MPSSRNPSENTHASTTPRMMPITPPMPEVITLSYRTIRRNCERVRPMARSMPISRVRSVIESTRVFTMPNSEMTTLIASRT